MKKAFLDSKWWFYIPIISLFFIPKMSNWVFDGKTTLECQWRDIIITFSLFIHTITCIGILMYFKL